MTYGCHSLPRPLAGATLKGSPFFGSQEWPFVNSTECQYDLSHKDPQCQGCKWAQEAPAK